MTTTRLTILAAVATVGLATPGWGQEARTIIVMDGSGSMWGQIDGTPKLQIAREAVAGIVGKIDAAQEIGLVAYGHRRRGDCTDIEILVDPAAGTGGAIVDAVNAMRFQGKTPLSDAVREAARSLRFTENPATVVLVTDGLETCAADPCALATELESAGIDFTAHVVGFGLSREDGAQVACLAHETGGQYLAAQDAASLSAALTQTVVAQPVTDAAPEPEPQSATLYAVDAAPASSGLSVTWTGPGAGLDYIDVVAADAPDDAPSVSTAPVVDGNPATLKLPGIPGAYQLRYRYLETGTPVTLASRPITVLEADITFEAPGTVELGAMFDLSWTGPGGSEDYADVSPQGAGVDAYWSFSYLTDSTVTLQAPFEVGTYDLRYVLASPQGYQISFATPLRVVPSTAELSAPVAVRPGAEFPVAFIGPRTPGDWIDLVSPGYEPHSGELDYFYLSALAPEVSEGTLTAPDEPGEYELRYILTFGDGGPTTLVRTALTVSPDAPELSE